MPMYSVVTLTKFLFETTYEVEAESKKEAVNLIESNKVDYERKSIQHGCEEYVETVSIEEIEA